MLPDYIKHELLSIPSNSTNGNDYNGAWNILLNHYFPPADGWIVVPQPRAPRYRNDAVDLGVVFKILHNKVPVILVELEAPASLRTLSARALADAQMRQRIAEFYDASPHAFICLSAFGTKICKYSIDKETNIIEPKKITIDDPNMLVDVAPLERWNIDLTTERGLDRIAKIFEGAKLTYAPSNDCVSM